MQGCIATTRHRNGDWAAGRNCRCYACGTNPEQGPVWQDLTNDGNAGRLCVTCIQEGIILHDRKATARIGMARERDLQDWLFHDIAKDFHVQREVKGRLPYGGAVIVDGIISPRDTAGWTDDTPVFAVEVKALIGRPTSTGDHTKWLAQMIDYTWADFDGYGRLPVLAAPGPVLTDHLNCRTVPRLLGQVGVGELVPFIDHGWTIHLQGHRIWSEAKGPVKNWSVHLRTGSR